MQKGQRPTVQTTRSFSRHEPSLPVTSPTRVRASTIQTPLTATGQEVRTYDSHEQHGLPQTSDIFESSEDQDGLVDSHPSPLADQRVRHLDSLEQLPVEIRILIERFLGSLARKSHATPLKIDDVASLFQDFYIQAEATIATHIASQSPTPSASSTRSTTPVGGKRRSNAAAGELQMLTPSEVSDKRKARRKLEIRRAALEESVERIVCEKKYDGLYRHRSTDDQERDAKLRSKTAALNLIGVGLKELHVDVPASKYNGDDDGRSFDEGINKHLAPAREAIRRMHNERYPLAKLDYLTAAHKSIVETLAQIFPSTSSADEVLPTLIYTLINSAPETINVASDLHFIQLFRGKDRMDGEAAYCLVNLEAAISFLETVDLSSLNTDQTILASASSEPSPSSLATSGPKGLSDVSSSSPQTQHERPIRQDVKLDLQNISGEITPSTPVKSGASAYGHQRRLSTLLQEQRDRIEAGKDHFLESADHAFDSINSTLKSSLSFYLGRLEEKQSDPQGSPVVIPKTLDDARQLVSPPLRETDDGLGISGVDQTAAGKLNDTMMKAEPRLLEAIAGKRNLRDRSADSTTSGGSGKRVAFESSGEKVPPSSATDSMGDLVKSFLPFPRFGGFGRPAGRSSSGPVPNTPPLDSSKRLSDVPERKGSASDVNQDADADLGAVERITLLRKARPPVKRFMEAKDANELKVGDIDDLLKDYKRLAEMLKEAIVP